MASLKDYMKSTHELDLPKVALDEKGKKIIEDYVWNYVHSLYSGTVISSCNLTNSRTGECDKTDIVYEVIDDLCHHHLFFNNKDSTPDLTDLGHGYYSKRHGDRSFYMFPYPDCVVENVKVYVKNNNQKTIKAHKTTAPRKPCKKFPKLNVRGMF
ncbi:MAG TPA: hypothetical protein O0X70_03565 [Methanocorpusculum sp.]|nr:hypothetical protein [Methanocorpusculum sp.]